MRKVFLAVLMIAMVAAMTFGVAFANHKNKGKGPHHTHAPCAGIGLEAGGDVIFCLP